MRASSRKRSSWHLFGLIAGISLISYFVWTNVRSETHAIRLDSTESKRDSSPVLVGSTKRDTADHARDQQIKESGATIVLKGRVIDAAFAGAPGVRIRARAPNRVHKLTRTGTDGSFSVPFGNAPLSEVHVSLLARSDDGTGANASIRIHPLSRGVIEVGTITLRKCVTLRVHMTHEGRPVVGADLWASSLPLMHAAPDLSSSRTPWSGWNQHAPSDKDGWATLEDVPAGAVRLLGIAEGPIRAEKQVRTDALADPLTLELIGGRDLQVEVVRESDGSGVPGCHVTAMHNGARLDRPWGPPTTNAQGVATLKNVPMEEMRLLIAGPNWCSPYISMKHKVPPDVTVFRTEVPSPFQIMVPIEVLDGVPPEDGSRVDIEDDSWAWWPGTRTDLARFGSVRGGFLLIERRSANGWISAVARLPDGRVGILNVRVPKQDTPERRVTTPVVFASPRALDVSITERGSGIPAAGVSVTCSFRDQGELAFGPIRTDAQGRARIEGLPSGTCVLCVCSNPNWVRPFRQAVFTASAPVSLIEGDASIQIQVEPLVDVVVRVQTEGKSGFPPELDVVLAYWPQAVEYVRPSDLTLHPRLGELRFRARRPIESALPPVVPFRKPAKIHLLLRSRAHATTTVPLLYNSESNRFEADVSIALAGSLTARVGMPADANYRTVLERFVEGHGWQRTRLTPLISFEGESDGQTYDGLAPGRYRLIEPRSGESSDEVLVSGGGAPTTLIWWLGSREYVEGVVDLPAGVESNGLKVTLWTHAELPKIIGQATIDGIHFRVPLPGSGSYRIYASHPQCKSTRDDPFIISGVRHNVRLSLELR